MRNASSMDLNHTEKEIIILKASLNIIDSIINYNVLDIQKDVMGSTVSFRTNIHQEYFSICLVDFFSKPTSDFGLKESNYISLLKDVCSSPVFDNENSIDCLKRPVVDFNNWLETEITIKQMWFPSISLSIDLKLTYSDFLYIGGNISKHNFTRLSFCANKLRKILEHSGCSQEKEDCFFALEDFQNWFHGDGNILGYLSGLITAFLNNIRWGIHRYLQPEFSRSYTRGDGLKYAYQYPTTVSNSMARFYYWDMMNSVRSEPYIPEFEVSIYRKNHPMITQ